MKLKPRVAVIALQGDFEKHIQVLTKLGADAYAARLPGDITDADALRAPGRRKHDDRQADGALRRDDCRY